MKEFESLFQVFETAIYRKDIEAFVSIFDEDVLVFDMWQRWTYKGLAAWRGMAESWFASLGANRDVVSFEDIQIHEDAGLATATAIVKFTAVSEKGEELRFLQNRLTWVARKKDGEWKIIHQHTSSPIDFETMKVILKR
jgi:uncharacterized protein (TIGR02246 family)